MSDVSVEIFQDQGAPLGGYAVIRFNGLWLLPPNATFTIEPVDERMAAGGDKEGWPAGKRRPLETRVTSKGIEILVGPEIVDAPLLLPGTPVTISVPEASVRVEARWPNLPVSRKVRGDPVVVSAEQLLTEVAAIERARLARQAVPPSVVKQPYVNGTGSQTAGAIAPPVVPKPVPAEAPPPEKQSKVAKAEPTKAEVVPLPAPKSDPAPSEPKSPPTAGVRGAGPTIAPSLAAFAAGFAAALIVSALAGYLMWPPAATAPAVAEPKIVERQVTVVPPLHAAFVAGPTSPRGRAAESVEISTALMLADQSLHATPGAVDREEAGFWLRKALSKALGGAQLSWALTQLGTIYAERSPGAEPDYSTAQALWEIAGAHGDPIALCFLGSLNENGLGMPVNKRAALGYYTRAKELGGCPGLDQSLARVTE